MAYRITSYFSENNEPKTGLTPIISIFDLSDNSLVIDEAEMSEIGLGGYQYDFTTYDPTKQYWVIADADSSDVDFQYSVGPSSFNQFTDEVVVGTNNDKTGYSLTTAQVGAIVSAILGAVVDGSLTVQQSLELQNAVTTGTTTVLNNEVTFNSPSTGDPIAKLTYSTTVDGLRTEFELL